MLRRKALPYNILPTKPSPFPRLLAAPLALALAACATAPGPVEVTRFIAPQSAAMLGEGTVFVTSSEASANAPNGTLEDAPYRAAVARQLSQLRFSEAPRSDASHIAEVRLDRYALDTSGARRGPVSVGVGGGTGSYGSGIGLGIGINLGGGGGTQLGTDLAVTIRDAQSGATLWEGRANFAVSEKSELAQPGANAQAVAQALFKDFPGNDGETVSVKVTE
jgi:hypothetical protein